MILLRQLPLLQFCMTSFGACVVVGFFGIKSLLVVSCSRLRFSWLSCWNQTPHVVSRLTHRALERVAQTELLTIKIQWSLYNLLNSFYLNKSTLWCQIYIQFPGFIRNTGIWKLIIIRPVDIFYCHPLQTGWPAGWQLCFKVLFCDRLDLLDTHSCINIYCVRWELI